MASMFSNIYDAEADINKMMSDTAISFGRLDANGYGPMTASTFGQGEMFGRALGGLLGGKDPRMEEAELAQELMRRHPDPRTKEELLAAAKDAASLGLIDLQAELLSIAAEMPEKKKASKEDINFLTEHMALTNASPELLNGYLLSIGNTQEQADTKLSDARNEFKTLINGYGTWLSTQNLSPANLHDYAFTDDVQITNQTMFKRYLEPMIGANKLAAYMYEKNNIFVSNGNNGNDNDKSGIDKKSDIDIEKGNQTNVTLNAAARGEDFSAMSKADQYFEQKRNDFKIATALEQAYEPLRVNPKSPKLSMIGAVGEVFMDKETLDEENKRDAVKDWMGGALGFDIRKSDAMEHFQAQPPEALQEFLQDPIKYFEENILRSQYYDAGPDGKVGTADDVLKDPEREIPTLWGIN
jgi:hypothetical protein